MSSLRHLGKTEDACETLLEVLDEFPGNAALPYQLACYFSQMEQYQEAKDWLERPFDLGNPKELRAAALTEPALV